MKRVARERPGIDGIACPWPIARFMDPGPEFLCMAAETGATPPGVPGVEYGHHGDRCSLHAFIDKHGIVIYDALHASCAETPMIERGRFLGIPR